MRGADTFTERLFTIRRLDDFVPAAHPLRPIREMVNAALAQMQPLFARMYEAHVKGGRPSIAQKNNWLLGEHFSVDGTLIQALGRPQELCAQGQARRRRGQ